MKLRILTSLMLVMFLSVGSATVASAHEGCHDDHYCGSWGHGWGWGWGHHWGGCGNNYVYGPDGLYAQCRDSHKSCCDKEGVDAAEHKCADKCEKSNYCGPRYERAYYHEYGCGWGGHLHSGCEEEHHGSCCDKKDKESRHDD